jgi:hypothetical protein
MLSDKPKYFIGEEFNLQLSWRAKLEANSEEILRATSSDFAKLIFNPESPSNARSAH